MLIISDWEEFSLSSQFLPVIPDSNPHIDPPSTIQKLIFCTGKVYYDLVQRRDENKYDNVAIVRIEQLAPFPLSLVVQQVNKYPQARVVWCQEGTAIQFNITDVINRTYESGCMELYVFQFCDGVSDSRER